MSYYILYDQVDFQKTISITIKSDNTHSAESPNLWSEKLDLKESEPAANFSNN